MKYKMDVSTSMSLVSEYQSLGGFATAGGTRKFMENAIKNDIADSHFRSFDNLICQVWEWGPIWAKLQQKMIEI